MSARIIRFPMERIKRRASGSWQCMDDLPPIVRSQRFLTDLFRELGFEAHAPGDDSSGHSRGGSVAAASGRPNPSGATHGVSNSPGTSPAIRGTAVPCDIESNEES